MRIAVPIAFAATIVACVATSSAWTRSHALQESLLEVAELEQSGQELATRMQILKTGIRQLDRSGVAGPFLTGWVPDPSGGQPIAWSAPRDGLYLVVSARCPWCLPLLKDLDGVERSFGSPLYLISDDARGIDRFLASEGLERSHELIESSGGWWNAGMPKQATPIWLLYEDGQLVDFGLGAPGDMGTSGVSSDDY